MNNLEPESVTNSSLLEVINVDFKQITSSDIENHIDTLLYTGLIKGEETVFVNKSYTEAREFN